MTMKVPPNNTEAEQAVLSSILYDSETMAEALSILKPEDFYNTCNAKIFEAMMVLHQNNTPIDAVTLSGEMKRRNTLEVVGGIVYLSKLVAGGYTSAHVKYYAQEVRRQSESRQILHSLTEIYKKHEDVTINDLREALQAAESKQYVKSHVEKSLQNIDEFKQNVGVKRPRVLTGFGAFDKLTGGLRVPSVAVIGAFPSVGKTAFSLNIAANQEGPVVFFSLEMSADMIYERLASSQLKINYSLFSAQQLSDKQHRDVKAFADKLKEKKFHVFDNVYFVEQQAQIISSIKPALVVIDYIQKVKTHKKSDNRRLEIDYVSGMYKQLAKNNNCVILVLSQLSRAAHSQLRPLMSNLKESGSLEADGDYVGILHRQYVLEKNNADINPEDADILVDKNKFGHTGAIDLYFNGKYQHFYEIDKRQPTSPVSKPKRMWYKKVDDDELPFPE